MNDNPLDYIYCILIVCINIIFFILELCDSHEFVIPKMYFYFTARFLIIGYFKIGPCFKNSKIDR